MKDYVFASTLTNVTDNEYIVILRSFSTIFSTNDLKKSRPYVYEVCGTLPTKHKRKQSRKSISV